MADRPPPIELTWPGKERDVGPPPCVLVEDPHRSSAALPGPPVPERDNLLVHGDNLAVLGALLPSLAGQVQCVYIDPPYNTGTALDHYEDGLDHAAWLSLMRSRLELLRALLAPTGSIFVQIDDNEVDYLKVLMDEVFGRGAFVGRMTVAARAPSAFSTVNRGVFKASEYLLWFARDKSRMKELPVRVPRAPDPAYTKWIDNPDEPHERWRLTTVRQAFERLTGARRRRDDDAFARFVLTHARHVCRFTTISDRAAGKATVALKYLSKQAPDRVHRLDRGPGLDPVFVLNGQQISFYDKNVRLIDGEPRASMPLTNIWTDIAWEGIAGEGGVRFKKGKKPERLLARCLELVTEPGDLVLDCFAGSGTTGAVAHKLGRRWVMIEAGEHCSSHILPRMQRVVAGEDPSGVTRSAGWQGGGGFRFLVPRSTSSL